MATSEVEYAQEPIKPGRTSEVGYAVDPAPPASKVQQLDTKGGPSLSNAVLETKRKGTWTNALFDCGSDIGTCLVAGCCPCVVYSLNQGLMGENRCLHCLAYSLLGPFCWVLGGTTRSAIREKFQVEGNCCHDLVTHMCCTPCALTQEHQQLTKNPWKVGIVAVLGPKVVVVNHMS
mmetsp:Transcript_36000/g.81968  ORF Transcript_36000/g.81968 Transcript_36000/m.81968 type:complete len:176 (+) Transcript_36000:56-583(+)|eukprot:CAMPEP_0114557388 /NCGR_PEP_ID=MMETSP0114-20121206/9805_1 /TAXON_ID=31324 /ORGANISM="Goniomonas sp, Strain m" /LENGTH=175 /DNA_ID=CAMNT_0001742675 /DNA_START=53 /DNA_END=580 /DNA_ORIENTATION=-